MMVELENAKRSLLQATYTPIKPKKDQNGLPKPQRAWEKWSFFASLKSSPMELEHLKRRFVEKSRQLGVVDSVMENALRTIEIIKPTIPELGTPNALRSVTFFSNLEHDTLIRIADGLIELRNEQFDSAIKAQKLILKAFHKEQTSQEPSKSESDSDVTKAINISSKAEEMPKVGAFVAPKEVNVKALMDWAITNNVASDIAAKTLDLTEKLTVRAETIKASEFNALASRYIDHLRNLRDAFRQRMEMEPVGFLHLERITFTPAGIERGELVSSVPLSPAEEVNISHKEWSNTSQEFEKIVTDFMEGYSEEGVTEKSEMSQSASSQEQHSSGFNTGVTATSGDFFGTVNVTASFGYNVADSATRSEQSSRNHSNTLTRKASSRVKKEHKISFKVASAAGTEDQAVRRIKNPFQDKATRVDYFQLMRKWKVDLYRYGLRLTYDITIPEPGSDIMSRIKEIEEIKKDLNVEFGPEYPPIHPPPGWVPESKPPWALFDLTPEEIDGSSYIGLAALYNADLPPELNYPDETIPLSVAPGDHNWTDEQANQNSPIYYSLEIPVQENYEIKHAEMHLRVEWNTEPETGDSAEVYYEGMTGEHLPPSIPNERGGTKNKPIVITLNGHAGTPDFRGKFGKVFLMYGGRYLRSIHVEVRGTQTLRKNFKATWRLAVWKKIQEAALARYNDHVEKLKQRLSQLTEELGAQDALSLRKIEREEVMKGVLRWMFGPHLEFWPSGVEHLYDQASETINDEQKWSRVLFHGEIINLLHQAIEWENMLYILYPYFWSDTREWELKKYLDHPDPMHRAFLKSGSARVILTIRPGFEKLFTTLLETGSYINVLQIGHPYIRITEEMENYAKTNYPGIRPANPVENARPLIYPKQKRAWTDMQIIMAFLDIYATSNDGKYPSSLADLRSIFPLKDPWGRNYVYTSLATQGNYALVSYGANGAPGGTDENADITGREDVNSLIYPKQKKAWKCMQIIITLLDMYVADNNGRYPSTLADLQSILKLKDPWNNDYIYTYPGLHGDYDLFSQGGPVETDVDSDIISPPITSWAEASLIGTWYEYTPTSAMDIAFNTEMTSG